MSSNRKILVTGAKGQLGQDLVRVLERDFKTVGADKEQFDIRDLKATRDFITAENPDVIVHSAAYTDVDGCEENREKAIKINGLGTRNVAIAARKTDARLFYISTDYVFSGDKSQPYVDFDPPNPQTVYGQSKLLGEKFVLEQLSEFCILRIAWLYGIHGGNFVKTMINKCEKGEDLQVVEDQAGSPTWAKDVARQVSTLIPTEYFGVYNSTARGETNWFEFSVEIFRELGFNLYERDKGFKVVTGAGKDEETACNLVPVSSEEFSRPAERPKNSVLSNELLQLQGVNAMPHWKEGLRNFIKEYDGGES